MLQVVRLSAFDVVLVLGVLFGLAFTLALWEGYRITQARYSFVQLREAAFQRDERSVSRSVDFMRLRSSAAIVFGDPRLNSVETLALVEGLGKPSGAIALITGAAVSEEDLRSRYPGKPNFGVKSIGWDRAYAFVRMSTGDVLPFLLVLERDSFFHFKLVGLASRLPKSD